MERETQYFKIPEMPKENQKKEKEFDDFSVEKNSEESEKNKAFKEFSERETQYFEIPEELKKEKITEKSEEEMFKNELEIKEKERKEKIEFLENMEKEEQKTIGGILRKITEIPPKVKKTIMAFAATGLILSAGKAFAGNDRFYKSHQEWQNFTKPFIEWGIQWAKPPEIDYQRQKANRERLKAYQEYQERERVIQREYENRKFDIMIGRTPRCYDYFSKQKAYQKLEEWKNHELSRARYEWSLKVWAIEEAWRMESQRRGR